MLLEDEPRDELEELREELDELLEEPGVFFESELPDEFLDGLGAGGLFFPPDVEGGVLFLPPGVEGGLCFWSRGGLLFLFRFGRLFLFLSLGSPLVAMPDHSFSASALWAAAILVFRAAISLSLAVQSRQASPGRVGSSTSAWVVHPLAIQLG